jgi:hypothetical protein
MKQTAQSLELLFVGSKPMTQCSVPRAASALAARSILKEEMKTMRVEHASSLFQKQAAGVA